MVPTLETHHELVQVLCTALPAHAHFYHHPTPLEAKPLRVSQQKDLGVLVNSNLSWSAHIVAICGKACYGLNLIRSIPTTSLQLMLKSFCSSLW